MKQLMYGLRLDQLTAVNALAAKTGLKPYEVTGRLLDLALAQARVTRVSVLDITLDPPKEAKNGE
jgi:hypothetical protein